MQDGQREESLEETCGGLTIHIEREVGLVAAHVAGGCAAVGAAVTLVEEGEDESTVLGHLEGWHTALLLPEVLLGAVEKINQRASGGPRLARCRKQMDNWEHRSQGFFVSR